MHVKNKKMYNFHRPNLYDSLWVPGNTFVIDGNSSNYYNQDLAHMSENPVKTLEELYRRLDCIEFPDNYTAADRTRWFNNLNNQIIYYQKLVREYALEEARKRYAPFRPSRLKSIWLSGEESKSYWKRIIANSECYLLEVNGELFKTNADLLPIMSTDKTYPSLLRESRDYWYPLLTPLKDKTKTEYLFQGEVKILDKIK